MEREEIDGWPPEPEDTVGRWAESLEEAVVEIRNMLPFLETAFSGIEYAAVALRAMDLGFDRHTAFWPQVFHKETTYGMAWRNDPELVSSIEPPPDLSSGWKLDPHYGDRVRYWNGEEWDVISAPAAGNLDLFKRIAAGEDVGEVPETVTIHPANSKEPDPIMEMAIGKPDDLPGVGEPLVQGSANPPKDDEPTAADLRRAEEIAKYVAERAFEFDYREARAWALTDFDVWATLAGESAQLSFNPESSDGTRGSEESG